MSGGGTTVEKTENKLPKWLRPHIEGMAKRSDRISRQKFKPWEGEAVLGKNRMERKAQRGIEQVYKAGERPEHQQGVSSLDAAPERMRIHPNGTTLSTRSMRLRISRM